MAKLYFKYGAMGSSKSAQALITKFNYEELGMTVWLIKPSTDTRDGADLIRSRIGLEAHAEVITPEQSILEAYRTAGRHDVIITDEAQFFTPEQIDELRTLVDEEDLPVLCFGLRTDFLTHFFPGAQRLMELADSITEIKTVCACGRKATVNARIDARGRVITEGAQVFLGGNDSYMAMCHQCWKKKIREQNEAAGTPSMQTEQSRRKNGTERT
ncbi:MAG: thymidine kinase [Oscillospiraceae bacterium]|nr:thymidine kinase [Oscillospiraceae bacterium]